jgi:hypothetical protein
MVIKFSFISKCSCLKYHLGPMTIHVMMSMLIVHLYFSILVTTHFEMAKEHRRKFRSYFTIFLLVDNRTIPVTAAGESDPQYRLTEDLTSHLNCRVRSRNLNLFTADQVIHLIRDNFVFIRIYRILKVVQQYILVKIQMVIGMVMNVPKNVIIIHTGNQINGL